MSERRLTPSDDAETTWRGLDMIDNTLLLILAELKRIAEALETIADK
jgi:hypothetical protein